MNFFHTFMRLRNFLISLPVGKRVPCLLSNQNLTGVQSRKFIVKDLWKS